MPEHMTQDLFLAEKRYGHIKSDEANAWFVIEGGCPSCSGTQAAVVGHTNPDVPLPILYGRCVNCRRGFVVNNNQLSPSVLPLRWIKGLEADTDVAWNEIRSCLSVGATTAAVHMCRKVLLHVAFEKGLDAKDGKDRSPTFVACIEHLESEGYVTPPMKPWVARIREIGNEGAHELPQISRESAFLVAEFTQQLLVLTYEMAAIMSETEQG